jgi:hypothetical protein
MFIRLCACQAQPVFFKKRSAVVVNPPDFWHQAYVFCRKYTSRQAMTDLIVREPDVAELARVAYFFRNHMLLPQAHILMALRCRPVERFVAAAAWWTEGAVVRFQLLCLPGAGHPEIFASLINRVTESARRAGGQRLHYADVLTEDDATADHLKRNGFTPLGKNRFFEARYADAWKRVMHLFEKCRPDLPPDWRTEPIRNHQPEIILDLVGSHRLMSATELHYYWQMNSFGGLELDASSILFDGAQPIGTMLVRTGQGTFYIDVRVVHVENRRLRSLGNLLLFQHGTARWPPGGQFQRLQFHGGEAEHRETANLAIRMGGRELPSRYIFAKPL